MAITERLRQLGWFVAIWAMSVAALGLVGAALKWFLRAGAH